MEKRKQEKPLMTIADLVDAGIGSRSSVYRWLREGTLPIRPVRCGQHLRFARRDFERVYLGIDRQVEDDAA